MLLADPQHALHYTRPGSTRDRSVPLLPDRRQGNTGGHRVRGRRTPRVPGSVPQRAGAPVDHPEAAHRVHRPSGPRGHRGDWALHPGGPRARGEDRLCRARLPRLVQLRARGRAGGLPSALPLHRGTPVIRVRGLRKEYAGGARALDDVNLEIGAGEFVALIGPSGAGKSSLLRCLNGMVVPTGGEVVVDGEAVTGARGDRLRRIRARVGFVFQQFNLLRRLSVLENVLVGRLASTVHWRSLLPWFPAADMTRARAALSRMGLGGLE